MFTLYQAAKINYGISEKENIKYIHSCTYTLRIYSWLDSKSPRLHMTTKGVPYSGGISQ